MPSFSNASKQKLAECHFLLQDLMNEVIKKFDCTILCGARGKEEQEKAFARGASKLRYPHSAHNKVPSLAVDVIPYPIQWPESATSPQLAKVDLNRMYYFGGFVLGMAAAMGIDIRWGGDWDGDGNLREQMGQFTDLPHYELRM